MRRPPLATCLLLCTGLWTSACQQGPSVRTSPQDKDPDRIIAGGGEIAPGWRCRTDEPGQEHNVRLVQHGGKLLAATGPNVIFYRPEMQARPPYRLSLEIIQWSKTHAHGSGLFFGGTDLQGSGQAYAYFLLRGDGTFLVKTRKGEQTHYLTKAWTRDEAVDVRDKNGRSQNRLQVEVGRETTVFRANGFEVFRRPTASLPHAGIFGLRFNHNLDLELGPIELKTGGLDPDNPGR